MVAGFAAMGCVGVVGMASRNIQDGIAELFRGRDNLTKGIEVHIDGDEVILDMYIIAEYGTRLQEVARNVKENVKYTVETQLGLDVSRVNVYIQGVQTGVKGSF
ncbi:MAG TPA: Asp23/Gls24 family envelope stress response protein [Firmicutes bacterium]|nr:Asp23/Gls24 family envelope stress response protein [Bacillota bacterium]